MPKSWRLEHNDEWKHFLDPEDREQFEVEVHVLMVPYLMSIIEELSKKVWPEEWPDVPKGD